MARGVRKSPLEKLQIELMQTQNSIQQYKENIAILKEQEMNLLAQIELEEFKALKTAMDEFDMTLEDVKALVRRESETQQSA